MKPVRYGNFGNEKLGLIAANGNVRDLSGHVDDVAGETLLPKNLTKLTKLDVETLPIVPELPQQGLRLGIEGLGVQTQRVLGAS